MKIVRIIARLNVGGPAKHVAWLTAATRRAGIESELIAGTVPPGEDDMSYFAAGLGVVPVMLPEMTREVSPKDAVAAWKLYQLFRRSRPDIVHTHTAKAGTVGRLAGLLYRWLTPSALIGRPRACRFVHTYHGHIFHSYYGQLKTLFFLTIERVLARIATDRIVAISQQQFREIHEQFGVGRAAQFRVIPLGLDLEAFANWRERRAAARSQFGAGEGELLIGIVGRLTEIKNHKLFIEAAHMYLKRETEATSASAEATGATAEAPRRARFVIIGDGQLRGELEAQARTLGIAERVTFTGMRDDPENFYPALDIVALTSLNEGTPLTLIEAMANARPVVATAVGGVVDLLGDACAAASPYKVNGKSNPADASGVSGHTFCERGVRVRTNDAEAFCEALWQVAGDEEFRRETGARGRAFVAEHYSKERLVRDVLNLYSELLPSPSLAAMSQQGGVPAVGPARGKGD